MVTAEYFIVTVLPGFQPRGEVRYLTCVGGFCLVCSDRIPLQPHSHPIHLKISGMSFEVYSLRCTIRVGNSNRSAFQSHAVRDFKTGEFLSSFLFRPLFISFLLHCVCVEPQIALKQKTVFTKPVYNSHHYFLSKSLHNFPTLLLNLFDVQFDNDSGRVAV